MFIMLIDEKLAGAYAEDKDRYLYALKLSGMRHSPLICPSDAQKACEKAREDLTGAVSFIHEDLCYGFGLGTELRQRTG